MDERVRELFERVRQAAEAVGEAAGTTARYAGQKAGSVIAITKLNLQIFDLNSEAAELLKAAGQIVYDAHLGAETDEEALSAVLTELDVKNAQIDELKERAAQLKNSRRCPACGEYCGAGDRFCKQCGATL